MPKKKTKEFIDESIVYKFALANAVKFQGKASEKAVLGKILAYDETLKSRINELKEIVNKIVVKVNSLSIDEQIEELQKIYPEFFIEEKKPEEKRELSLPNVKNKVVLRFEPSASGPLHIGHALILALNYLLCKKYGGKLILRIADTNPENVYEDAYEMIIEDAKWLTNNNVDEIIIQSDRLGIYYDYAEELINHGYAYVCTCNPDYFRELLMKSKPCPCRSLPINEQIERFGRMFSSYKAGEAVVRLKADLNNKNPALRDFPLLRINDSFHPRKGKEHRVWPLMNFSVAIDDLESGITHVIRGKDHMTNTARQKLILKYLKKKNPEYVHIGLVHFTDFKLSTSEIRKEIEYGKYKGFDDPRLPFLISLRKRGYQAEALLKYAEDIGLSQADKKTSIQEFFKKLDAFNRELLDKKANRYFFVWDPIAIKIQNVKETKKIKLKLHPDFPERGYRIFKVKDEFYLSKDDVLALEDGQLYRLMDCMNFVKQGKEYFFHLSDYEYFKKEGSKILHWLPKARNLVNVEVIMPDASIKKGLAEEKVKELEEGIIIQFERFGFCRLDKKEKNKLVFYFTHK